jgi:hypothetical protein
MGMTFVDAINEVVETILEFPMSGTIKPSGLSDTSSVYFRAEQFLDRENKRIQAWGWPENTQMAKEYTTADGNAAASAVIPGIGGHLLFTTAGEVLKVRGGGKDAHRILIYRQVAWTFNPGAGVEDYEETALYDMDRGSYDVRTTDWQSTDGTTTDKVHLDITTLLDFDYLPTHLQDVIVARAKWTFQRRMQGNMQLDAALMQEYLQAEGSALRNAPSLVQSYNVKPMIPSGGGGQAQKGG